jgi:hypothetical protein
MNQTTKTVIRATTKFLAPLRPKAHYEVLWHQKFGKNEMFQHQSKLIPSPYSTTRLLQVFIIRGGVCMGGKGWMQNHIQTVAKIWLWPVAAMFGKKMHGCFIMLYIHINSEFTYNSCDLLKGHRCWSHVAKRPQPTHSKSDPFCLISGPILILPSSHPQS